MKVEPEVQELFDAAIVIWVGNGATTLFLDGQLA
jgi:hypothetical protein